MDAFVDRRRLQAQRRRAERQGLVGFLREAARAEIEDRLNEVNRRFTAPAVVTGFPGSWDWPVVVADDPVLALAPGAHDLVVHDMALHWAEDPVGQLVQMRHALSPDGLMLATMFGGQTLHELRACLAEAEIAVSGGLSPRVAPMGEIRDLGGLLQRAGFALPVADGVPFDVSYATPFDLMRDLRAMGEGNALSARLRRPTRRAVFLRAAEIYAARFGRGDGRLRATFEVIVLTGWAPGPGQQKPLRPGTAAYRLAEALGTAERPLDRERD